MFYSLIINTVYSRLSWCCTSLLVLLCRNGPLGRTFPEALRTLRLLFRLWGHTLSGQPWTRILIFCWFSPIPKCRPKYHWLPRGSEAEWRLLRGWSWKFSEFRIRYCEGWAVGFLKCALADRHQQDDSFRFDVFLQKLAEIYFLHGWQLVVEYQEQCLLTGV